MNSGPGETLRLTLLVLGAVALAAGWLWSVRLRQGGARTPDAGGLMVVSRLGLEHRRTLYLVRAGRQDFLVGSSEGGLAMLAPVESSPREDSCT